MTQAYSTTLRDEVEYRSNRDGSPKYAAAEAAVVLGRSQLYGYDDLHRLTSAKLGRLNGGRTAMLEEWAEPAELGYTMDILGNITTLDRENSGTSANETRAYNATNELTSRTVVGEAARYWVNDDFADNDTVGWSVADLNGDAQQNDGTWSAASGALACTGTISETGAPDSGAGSLLLVDEAYYQDVRLTCSATLSAGADNAGLVFGYQDPNNFWVKIYSKAQQKTLVYEVNAGTWTQRSSSNYTITAGTAFTMTAEVRAGQADTYAGTVLAGQVGLWCSHGTANSLDDFQVRDIAGPFEVDGKYFCSTGQVRTDESDNNVLEAYGTDGLEGCIIRRGFRGATYVATYKFKWNASSSPGWVVRWLSPGDYIVVYLGSDGGPNCYKREADGTLSSLTMGGSALNLTTNTWYEAKVVVDDPNSDGAQRLRYWVDTDGDGDYADETVLINT
ncbi:MAG: hypothetical protein AB1716_25030, partial [Planctomycetota bacterium]